MAFDISSLVGTGLVGTQVQNYTNDAQAAVSAAGYAAFVQAITGVAPTVTDLGNGRAKIILSGEQNAAMQSWLDSQVKGMLTPTAKPPVVDLSVGAYLTPWTLKYTAPALIGAFAAGWVLHWIMGGK